MLKNRFFSIFAMVALVGLAACGGDDELADDAVIVDDPAMDATVPMTDPAAPIIVDTDVSGMPMDTGMMMGDTMMTPQP